MVKGKISSTSKQGKTFYRGMLYRDFTVMAPMSPLNSPTIFLSSHLYSMLRTVFNVKKSMMVVADGDDGQSRSCAKPCPCRELVSADVRRLLIRRHLLDSWYQRSSKSCIDCSDEKISPSGLNSHGARRPVISSSSSAIYAPRECSSVQVSLNKQPRRPVRRMLWSNVTPAAAMTRHDSGE
jgi:hypothetical protein